MNTYTDIKLIGLAGISGSGKDTLADLLKTDNWERKAYADSLKNICIEYLGLSHDDAYTQEGKRKHNEFWGMTNREILQKVGTDAMRNGFHPEVWTKMLELKLNKALQENKRIIITDCRFDNEADVVEKLGGIIMKIERKNWENQLNESEKNHVSEQGLNQKYITEIILNDRDIPNLKNEFYYKLNHFQSLHKNITDDLTEYDKKKLIDEKITEKSILMIKKFIKGKIDAVFPLENGNLRFEWNKVRDDYYCSLVSNKENLIFKAITKNTSKPIYELNFNLNDHEKWIEINQWINQ